MNFAIEAGFMSESEREEAQKMLEALKKGVKPPSCRGKKECEEFCTREENIDQCVSFAEAAGFMSPEQAASTRKTRGRGPGGCKGAQCETFCNDPQNQEICFQYSVDNDLISEDDRNKMRQGSTRMMEELNRAPKEVADCVRGKMGDTNFDKMQSGGYTREEGNPFATCFDQYMKEKGGRPEGGDERRQFMRPEDAQRMMRPEEPTRDPQSLPISSPLPSPEMIRSSEPVVIPPPEPAPTAPSEQQSSPTSMNLGPESLQAFVINSLKLFLGQY